LTTHSRFTHLNRRKNPGAGISLDLAFNRKVISNVVWDANDLAIFMRASRDNRVENISILVRADFHGNRQGGISRTRPDLAKEE
jgi:hypothetical protein